MLRHLLSTILFSAVLYLQAQPGFIQAYRLGHNAASFSQLTLQDDLLVVTGTAFDTTHQQWGLLFARFDTLGQLIDQQLHLDPLGRQYIFDYEQDLIATTDGGFLTTGQVVAPHDPVFLAKMDKHGQLEWLQEYPDTTGETLVVYPRHLLALEDGFLLAGRKQKEADYVGDLFLIKTDLEGNKLWEKSYGEYNRDETIHDLVKIDATTYLIAYTYSNYHQGIDIEDVWYQNTMIVLDSMGDIQESITDPVVDLFSSSLGRFNFHLSDNGHYTYSGIYSYYLTDEQGDQSRRSQGEISKEDADQNILWKVRFGLPSWSNNAFMDMAEGSDGSLVAVGRYLNPDQTGFVGAWSAKVSAQGDSLWMRNDTLFYNTTFGADTRLNGVVIHPNGSIYAAGYGIEMNSWQESFRQYGLLLNLDANGCLQTPNCHTLTDAINLSKLALCKVFPNPWQDVLHIECPGAFDVQLFNMQGQLLYQQSSLHQLAAIQTPRLAAASYVLKIKHEDGWVLNQVLVKHD